MKKTHCSLKVLLLLVALAAFVLPSCSDVKINEGNGVNIAMENAAMKVNIAVEGGGRISQLIDKKSGKDLVTLWKNPAEDGGLLDDRNVFTAMAYSAAVMQPGGKTGAVRLTAKNSNGMAMTKILTLRDDSSELEVSETFSNGTQKPARFMLRSFMLPDGGPLSDGFQYFVPEKDKPLQPLMPAHGYYQNLQSPWSAVWNSKTGDGILVAAPGVDRFYFWQGSKIYPTHEWIYPEVPAGKSITVHYVLQLVHNAAPDWQALGAAALKGVRGVHFADVPGWQNEEQRFHVTDAERARGFWLSAGDGDGKRRLPPLRIDVPLNQSRSIYIGINALKDWTNSDLHIDLQHIPQGLVQTAWQVSGKDSIKVLSFNGSRNIDLGNGTEGRLWLTLKGGAKAVDAKGDIQISLNGQKVLLPLEVKVWPVKVPPIRPFEIRGYGTLTPMTAGYKVTPEGLKMLDALLQHFSAMGGDVLDWTVSWPAMYPQLKIVGTAQTVSDWIKKNRAAFADKPAAEWPQVDFSYYDPWMKIARKYGVTRGVTYLGIAPGHGMSFNEEEWILTQLKKYFQSQGMHGYFCKIADEIAPEKLPGYIAQAKVAQRAGWRPFTTVTGTLARTASYINKINPYMDEWQLGIGSTEFFKQILHQPYQLETHTLTLPAKWGKYGNGGAKDTVAQKLFESLIPGQPSSVENLEVFQDGKPLQKLGGSAWGNQKRGVYFFGFNDYLYLSPLEGTDAGQSTFTVKYQVRVPAATGEPLAKIDATDEVWFYGGGTKNYAKPYGYAASYPLKALYGNYGGYGWYAYYRWNADKVLWYDGETGEVSVSPAYLGLRDGWNDACLMAWLAKDKHVPVSTFISEKPDAPLRIGDVQQEVYRWKNIVNITDPFALNAAREKMLAAAG